MRAYGSLIRVIHTLYEYAESCSGGVGAPVSHFPVRLFLLFQGTLGGLDPGLPHFAVVLRPPLGSLVRIAHFVDPAFQIVELLLVEDQRVQEPRGHRVILGQLLVDYGRYTSRVVQLSESVLGVLQVPQRVALVHPVR